MNRDTLRVAILLNGRGSSKEAVMGSVQDYSKGFGRWWAESGWTVYAVDVNDGSPSADLSFPRLGLSATGVDIAKIEDLLKYVHEKHGPSAHIVVVGISYGARLAELSGLFFDEIDGIVSIGGSGRYDYLSSEFSTTGYQVTGEAARQRMIGDTSPYEQIVLSGGNVFRLLRERGRLVLVSLGVADAGQWGESGQEKFFMLRSLLNERDPLFRVRFFQGGHQSNPRDEVLTYMEMMKAINH